MIKRKSILFIVAGFTLLALAGCGGGGREQAEPALTFMYWADSPQAALMYSEWVSEFNTSAQQPVQETSAPFGSGYDQKLVILIGAQKAPDLFLLRPDQLPPLIEKQGLLALDERLTAEGIAFPDPEQYPHVYGPDGKVYGIPLTGDASMVIFAKTKQPDLAWELLKFLLKKAGAA